MSDLNNNKRIMKNTAFLYMRMLLVMLITLYTSRIVLAELGFVDYGLYNVIAGVVAMLGFLKSAMSLSVQRFLSYEMGQGNQARLSLIFNVSLYAHILLALLVLILSETIGLWFVKTQLIIPEAKLDAALIVYQCVIISSVFSIIEVPYNAVILAAERFGIYAYIGIIEVILKLLVAYSLMMTTYDKLAFYGIIVMLVSFVISMSYVLYAIKNFSYVRFRWKWNFSILRNILGFSVWSLLGELAWVFVNQGINILINIFCGPVVNAARAISYQVNSAICSLTRSFQQALNPQIIKKYAVGNLSEMNIMLFRGTRFSFYLLLLFSVPLLLETDFILNLWLEEVPKHTVLFCRLVLIASLVDALSNLLATVAKAYGQIRNYQIVVSFFLLLNFPISYIFLKMGFLPEVTMIIYIVLSVSLIFVRLFFAKKMVGLSCMEYVRETIYPILLVSILVFPILFFIKGLQQATFLRFIYSCLSSTLLISCVVFFFGMKKSERTYLLIFIKNKLNIK